MLRARKQTRGVKQMVIVFPRYLSLPSRLKGDRRKRGNEEREEGRKQKGFLDKAQNIHCLFHMCAPPSPKSSTVPCVLRD